MLTSIYGCFLWAAFLFTAAIAALGGRPGTAQPLFVSTLVASATFQCASAAGYIEDGDSRGATESLLLAILQLALALMTRVHEERILALFCFYSIAYAVVIVACDIMLYKDSSW